MRNRENKDRPSDSGESQKNEGGSSWIKDLLQSATSGEEKQVEEKIERTSGFKAGEKPMNYQDTLSTATLHLQQAGKEYGDVNTSFYKASAIASNVLNKTITPYDVAMVMMAINLSRISSNPSSNDSWVDLIGNAAIASHMSYAPKMPQTGEGFLSVVENAISDVVKS